MANNRMWLVNGKGEKILLCKFYPTTRWYMFCTEEKLNEYLERTTIESVHERGSKLPSNTIDLWGPTDYKLEFEIEEGT